MSLLSMMEAKLPPGFRFHPLDEELISDYLAQRASGDRHSNGHPMMIDVDLNKCEPWQLPETACVGGKEWYFYSLRDRKYATGQRTNRATVSGYWKATGKDRQVKDGRRNGGGGGGGGVVGMRKTLVFYKGRAPKGKKTEWVMHEFRMEGPRDPLNFSFQEDWVLCRVFYKSRGISAKTSMEDCYDDTGSSSLPPLVDSYINFEQTPLNIEGYEQVPCFSNLILPPSQQLASQHQNQTLSYIPPLQTNTIVPTKSFGQLGGIPDFGTYLNPFSCEKKVIKAVLDHLTKLEGDRKPEATPNLADGSSESYLTEAGMPSMWSPF